MAYARLDDGLDGHPKRRKAGHEAFGVWVAAIIHSNAQLLDGKIDAEWFERELPQRKKREQIIARLVELRMLESNGDGFYVHDYHEYNPSKSEVLERREKAARKKAAQRMSQGESPGDNYGESPGESHVEF